MNKTEQTLIFRQRWAAEHGMPLDEVYKLVRLVNKAGRYMTYYCNGEPRHPESTTADKSENARLWLAESGKVDARIIALVKPYGFDGLDYNGLSPSLVKNKREVRVPL